MLECTPLETRKFWVSVRPPGPQPFIDPVRTHTYASHDTITYGYDEYFLVITVFSVVWQNARAIAVALDWVSLAVEVAPAVVFWYNVA